MGEEHKPEGSRVDHVITQVSNWMTTLPTEARRLLFAVLISIALAVVFGGPAGYGFLFGCILTFASLDLFSHKEDAPISNKVPQYKSGSGRGLQCFVYRQIELVVNVESTSECW